MSKNVVTFISTVCNEKYRFLDCGSFHHLYKSPCFIRRASRLNQDILNHTERIFFHYALKSYGVYEYLYPLDYGQWLNRNHHSWEKAVREGISGWKSQNCIHSRWSVFPYMDRRNQSVSEKEILRFLERSFPRYFTNKWETDCISKIMESRFFFKVMGDSYIIGCPP